MNPKEVYINGSVTFFCSPGELFHRLMVTEMCTWITQAPTKPTLIWTSPIWLRTMCTQVCHEQGARKEGRVEKCNNKRKKTRWLYLHIELNNAFNLMDDLLCSQFVYMWITSNAAWFHLMLQICSTRGKLFSLNRKKRFFLCLCMLTKSVMCYNFQCVSN